MVQVSAGTPVVVVDTFLVEVERWSAGVDGHRDWAHGAHRLLEVLGVTFVNLDIFLR